MIVLTPDRKSVTTDKELTAAFEEHRDHGHSRCIQLHRDDGAYLSAIGEGFGPYALEWYPPEGTGIPPTVAEELKCREVLESLVDFLRGSTAWRESRVWHEL